MSNRIKAIAFDLDGTLYFGSRAVEGAVEALKELEANHIQLFFFTNNSAKTVRQIVTKLHSLGFNATERNTYTASSACARYLEQQRLGLVYLIGSDDFRKDLEHRGIAIAEPEKAAAVVVGLDFGLTYERIAGALQAILHGARLVVANIDASYPVEHGHRLPGCGAMVGAVVGASGHQPDFIAGKPSTYMLELLCSDQGLGQKEICVVGDSIESDIEMADRFQCRSILYDHFDMFKDYLRDRATSFKHIINILN
ncbi:MAG: HAD-IIA family hydrolase [Chlorobaculum sp.]|jgi:HAD superfamily hydrolase (TIGR01450 family)|nr:HAD-IIA family hydrolase [Chlorobaculum sp.]